MVQGVGAFGQTLRRRGLTGSHGISRESLSYVIVPQTFVKRGAFRKYGFDSWWQCLRG